MLSGFSITLTGPGARLVVSKPRDPSSWAGHGTNKFRVLYLLLPHPVPSTSGCLWTVVLLF